MTRLPRVTASRAIATIERHGFVFARQSGSHKIFKNADGRRVTVPFHASKVLHPKVFKSILDDSGLTAEDFL